MHSPHTVAIMDEPGRAELIARALMAAGIGPVALLPRYEQAVDFIEDHLGASILLARPEAFGANASALRELLASAQDVSPVVIIDRDAPLPDHAISGEELARLVSEIHRTVFPVDQPADWHPAFAGLITSDPRMCDLLTYVQAVAKTNEPVLITGETGTGKELIARAIHRIKEMPGQYVAVNVAGYDDAMFADSLFGHRKGAFTGASDPRAGMILRASGGTLFLDEIGDLSIPSQVKLLRLLQEREYFPLGCDTPKRSTARVVCATSADLSQLQETGRFRADLFYRLSTHHVHLPPLRERLGDLPLLCRYFLAEAAKEQGKGLIDAGPELIAALSGYSFPGNVRELRALLHDAITCSPDGRVSMAAVRARIGDKPVRFSSPDAEPEAAACTFTVQERLPTLAEAQQQLIREALRRSGGNQAEAAAMLGITRQALNQRLRRSSLHTRQLAI